MIVVSDTTALTTLIKSGLDWMLPRLFDEIRIPEAVADELLQFHPVLPDCCIVRECTLAHCSIIYAGLLIWEKLRPSRWLMNCKSPLFCWMTKRDDGRRKRLDSPVWLFLRL